MVDRSFFIRKGSGKALWNRLEGVVEASSMFFGEVIQLSA